MLEVPLTAEVLPVRVLAPALDELFVAQRIDMLEVEQRGHQARGQCGPACGAGELWTPGGFKGLPVDQATQAHEFVALVDQVDEFQAEQVVGVGVRSRLGAYRISARNCKKSKGIGLISCNSRHWHWPGVEPYSPMRT